MPPLSDGAGFGPARYLLLRVSPAARFPQQAEAEYGYSRAASRRVSRSALGCAVAQDIGLAEQRTPAALPPAGTPQWRWQFQPDISVLCPPPPVILDQFTTDDDRLKAAHRTRIGTLAQEIVDSQTSLDPIHTLCILGHTDSVGPETHNQDLAARRAIAVAGELETALEAPTNGAGCHPRPHVESRARRRCLIPTLRPPVERTGRVEIFLNRAGCTPRPPLVRAPQ